MIRKAYKGSDELQQLAPALEGRALTAVFDHVRSASFYLSNIFESYLERFVGVLEQSAARAQSRALILYVALSALVTAVALFVGLFLARSILFNLRLVDGAIERMSEGDFSSRVAPSGHDEIGLLAERVNLSPRRG